MLHARSKRYRNPYGIAIMGMISHTWKECILTYSQLEQKTRHIMMYVRALSNYQHTFCTQDKSLSSSIATLTRASTSLIS